MNSWYCRRIFFILVFGFSCFFVYRGHCKYLAYIEQMASDRKRISVDSDESDKGRLANCWAGFCNQWHAFLKFLYNPADKTVFGRGGKSWGKFWNILVLSVRPTTYCQNRQFGREGKDVVFMTNLIAWFGFNPHPTGYVVPSLNKTLYDDCLCFEVSNNSATSSKISGQKFEEIHWITRNS